MEISGWGKIHKPPFQFLFLGFSDLKNESLENVSWIFRLSVPCPALHLS